MRKCSKGKVVKRLWNRKYNLKLIVPESWQAFFIEIKLVTKDVFTRHHTAEALRVWIYNVLCPKMFSNTSSSSSMGGADWNSAYRTSAFEAVFTLTPRLWFLRSSPEALHARQHERTLWAKGRSVGEKWPTKFRHVIAGFFNMPQSCDMGQTALLHLRRKGCCGFFRPKNPTASAGIEPAFRILT
jgi:hypothetical protein